MCGLDYIEGWRPAMMAWDRLPVEDKLMIGQLWNMSEMSPNFYATSPAGRSAQLEFPELPINLLLFAHMAFSSAYFPNLKVLLQGSLSHTRENGDDHIEIFCRNEAYTEHGTCAEPSGGNEDLLRLDHLNPVLPFRRITKHDDESWRLFESHAKILRWSPRMDGPPFW